MLMNRNSFLVEKTKVVIAITKAVFLTLMKIFSETFPKVL